MISIEDVKENLEQYFMTCAVNDPLSNFTREQDHFIKYASATEVEAWKEYNKTCKDNLKNKFGSSTSDPNFRWRDLIEMPSYIYTMLDLTQPGYFSSTPEGLKRARNFAKRNPLFCKAEVV